MELTPTMTTTSEQILFFFKFLFQTIKLHNFFSDGHYFIQSLLGKWDKNCNQNRPQNTVPITKQSFSCHEDPIGEKLNNAEVNMVMGKLGIACDPRHGDFFSAREVSLLFEEEPSLEEVRDAFGVFDQNRDGFIDAAELQRVLCGLGFEKVSKFEHCVRMIRAFDENGDGLMDLSEFVKFMEKCFS
ncbi:Calcium-binding protein CML30 [Actinidia chinensis var. chinensis]|uniref:Calcium-binding protein CML30 n=1 Tax=Actinidia chinensis var. chinensis TaxID=1590841 RepID=A0A2R6PBS9_ACTCC|nr:Calcium-binding protein CML30 [Actinidia chinensis var. chinensis]